MIAAGLPVVTSMGPELSYLLQDHGAALTFAVGDWQALGQHLIKLAQNSTLRDRLARTAYSYAINQLSFAATTATLRTWVRAPKRAPDKKTQSLQVNLRGIEYQTRSLVRQIMWRTTGADK